MIKTTWCWVCDDFLESSALATHAQLAHPLMPLMPPRDLSQPLPVLSPFHDPQHPEKPHSGLCEGWDEFLDNPGES